MTATGTLRLRYIHGGKNTIQRTTLDLGETQKLPFPPQIPLTLRTFYSQNASDNL